MEVQGEPSQNYAAGIVPLSGVRPCNNNDHPAKAFLNAMWDQALIAGNFEDYYRNLDSSHSHITMKEYPQLNLGTAGWGYGNDPVPGLTNIVGNASVGIKGMYGYLRVYAPHAIYAGRIDSQYRSNQHYVYPAVFDLDADPSVAQIEPFCAMQPGATQSVGKSGSDQNIVQKIVWTLAAFKPEVKQILHDNGMLMPTIQMIFRRTRVNSDEEYLTGKAHPAAFNDLDNGLEMVQMAYSIDTGNMPPLVQLAVVDTTFGSPPQVNFNSGWTSSEIRYETPSSIATVFYGTEKTKTITVSAADSFDLNNNPLTFQWRVLRGDPAKIRIIPTEPDGSEARIEFDWQPLHEIEGSKHTSSLAVVGVFAHNGSFYSPPAFVTCLSPWNERRTYNADGLLETVTHLSSSINTEDVNLYAFSYKKDWSSDSYKHDFNRRVCGWTRTTGTTQTPFSADGLIVKSTDPLTGRPATVSEIYYTVPLYGDTSTPEQAYPSDHWQAEIPIFYESIFLAAGQAITNNYPSNISVLAPLRPGYGHFSHTYDFDTGCYQTIYEPKAGFDGVEVFTLLTADDEQEIAYATRYRVSVGPPDTTPPSDVTKIAFTWLTPTKLHVSWPASTDDREVLEYAVYRDGILVARSFTDLFYEDEDVDDSQLYEYSVVAIDDAGNASQPLPVMTSKPNVEIWGQDDFADGNYTAIDPDLEAGLSWEVLAGVATINKSGGFQVGVNQAVPSLAVTKQRTIKPPFSLWYRQYQAYVTGRMGPALLVKDKDNFYLVAITKEHCSLYRTDDGLQTLLASTSAIKTQHQPSTADFEIVVTQAGGALFFEVTMENWSASPGSVYSATLADTDTAAVARFAGEGNIGFYQPNNTFNAPIYKEVKVVKFPAGRDINGNGVADVWERYYFGSAGVDLEGDPDGDGMSNLAEYIAGTDPTSSASTFQITGAAGDATGSGLTLTWPSIEGRKYDVLHSTSISPLNWIPVPGFTGLTATPPANSVEIPIDVGRDFFKISVRMAD